MTAIAGWISFSNAYTRSVNRCSRLADLADCERVLREGGPEYGVVTLDCVLHDVGVDAMCRVVRR